MWVGIYATHRVRHAWPNKKSNGQWQIFNKFDFSSHVRCEVRTRTEGSATDTRICETRIPGWPGHPRISKMAEMRRCGDAELSTWALGPGPGAKVLKSGWNINCCLCQLANWPSSHPANRQFPSTTSLLAARATRWPPRSWRRLELLVASG